MGTSVNHSEQSGVTKDINHGTMAFPGSCIRLRFLLFVGLALATPRLSAQCTGPETVYATDFAFTPELTSINVGDTVVFINAQGVHNVDGTVESNPVPFFLESTEGDINGVCMGTIVFDVPGIYTFESSIGVQAELGMTGTIVVDAVTVADRLFEFWGGEPLEELDAFLASYVFTAYFSSAFIGGVDNPGWLEDIDLDGNEPFTVFVPNDPAVEELMELINLGQFDLASFYDMPEALRYHIVPGIHLASELEDGMELPTVEGQNLTITLTDGGAQVNDAQIITTDLTAFNGVLHLIDKILAPPGYPAATTWDVIVQSPDHTLFEQALLNEGLDEALRGQPILNDNEPAEGPFTVFAPTDDALIAFAEENGFASVEALLSSQFMDDIVYGHLVEAVYESSDLVNGQNLVAYNNTLVNITANAEGIAANTAPISTPDLLAYNGVVHALGEVMPFTFPPVEGTCGSWTFELFSDADWGPGWQGSTLNVFADGNLIATESKTTDGPESFSVPVDLNTRIDLVFIGSGATGAYGYDVIDASGNLLFSTSGSVDFNGQTTLPQSVFGLKPCGEAPSCGLIEIVFTDDSQDGWFGGNMAVYSGTELAADIFFNPDFDGDGFADYIPFIQRRVLVAVDAGEVNFVVNPPIVFAEFCGYVVSDPEGNVVVNETSTSEAPPSTYGVEICEATASSVQETGQSALTLFPNPVTGWAQIQGLHPSAPWSAEVLSIDGKVVHHQRGTGPTTLQLAHLPAGFYTLRITQPDQPHATLKFIKS